MLSISFVHFFCIWKPCSQSAGSREFSDSCVVDFGDFCIDQENLCTSRPLFWMAMLFEHSNHRWAGNVLWSTAMTAMNGPGVHAASFHLSVHLKFRKIHLVGIKWGFIAHGGYYLLWIILFLGSYTIKKAALSIHLSHFEFPRRMPHCKEGSWQCRLIQKQNHMVWT